MSSRPRGRARGGPRRWLVRAARIAAILFLAAPLALMLLYRVVPPPITPLMVIRLAEGYGLDRDWVPLDEISPALARAVIAAEDNRFCRHWGIDVGALRDAVNEYLAGEGLRGASTITMQTVKNLFLWPGRDFIRKGLEAYLSVWIEFLWSKKRILEVYLNIVELGPGIYGAEAAARRHFGVPAARLNDSEAATLAAVLPDPLDRSAGQPSAAVRARAGHIAARARRIGWLLDCLPATSR